MWRRLALILFMLTLALSGCAAVRSVLRDMAAAGPNSDQPYGDPTPQPKPSTY
jgi:uncharacterized protein YceK